MKLRKGEVEIVEWEIRTIDSFGDAVDVDHYESESAALANAHVGLAMLPDDDGGVALAVEQHISRRPSRFFDTPDEYTTVWVGGTKDALEAWGWKPGECTWIEN